MGGFHDGQRRSSGCQRCYRLECCVNIALDVSRLGHNLANDALYGVRLATMPLLNNLTTTVWAGRFATSKHTIPDCNSKRCDSIARATGAGCDAMIIPHVDAIGSKLEQLPDLGPRPVPPRVTPSRRAGDS